MTNKQPEEFGFSPVCLCTMRTMMMTPIWNFWISTTRMWIRIKKRQAKWDALIWNQSYESCSTARSSWNKTILASQTHFQNMDNQSWKPLSTINSKFPVAVPVGKGVIRCQFAESWNMLEGFVILTLDVYIRWTSQTALSVTSRTEFWRQLNSRLHKFHSRFLAKFDCFFFYEQQSCRSL